MKKIQEAFKSSIIYKTVFLLLITISCNNDDDGRLAITSIELNKAELRLNVGDEEAIMVLTDITGNEVNWSSSNENVAVVDDQGIVTTKAGGSAIITATVNNAIATVSIIVDPDVFTAGVVTEDGISAARYWRNGTPMELEFIGTTGTFANDIFVNGDDVYVVGEVFNGPNISDKEGILWKNGKRSLLNSAGDLRGALSVHVEDNIVSVLGLTAFQGDLQSEYWRDDTGSIVQDNNYLGFLFNSIHADGADVYMAGIGQDGNEFYPVIWKNGTVQRLSDKTDRSNVFSITTNENDVHAAGFQEDNGISKAIYWKNGEAFALSEIASKAYSVFVSDAGDVYVAGEITDVSNETRAVYWKNGTPTTLGIGVAGVIQVFDDDVYVSGLSGSSNFGYWKNGVPVNIPTDATDLEIFSIFIR